MNRKILLIITSILAIIKATLSVFFAFMLKSLLDYFETGTKEDIYNQMLIASCFLISYIIIESVYFYFESLFITRRMQELKTSTMQSVLRSSIINFNTHHSGEYLSILTNDSKAIEDDYYGSIFECITLVFNLGISVIALIYLNPVLGVISIVSSILSLLVPMIISNKLGVFRNKFSEKQDKLTRKTKSVLDGFETIKTYDVEDLVLQDYSSNVEEVEKYNRKLKFMLKSALAIGRAMGYLVFFTIIFTGLFLSLQGRITFGILLASIQLSNNLVSPIVLGVQMMARIRSTKQIRKKFNFSETKLLRDKATSVTEFNNSIELKNISFSYNENTLVLSGISMKIEKGRKYALVGKSGSGKSTLAKIILGIIDQYKGEIMIDDVDFKHYCPESIVKLFSVINQNTFLFDDSIEKNVSFYKSVPVEKIHKVLNEVQLSRFVTQSDVESKKTIGENGVLLSGGERQRVSLARAFANDCPIIVMDEATSQLDNENMLQIENLLLNSTQTVISITHRLIKEILQKYDVIYVLSDGQIVEHGTFEELMDKKGELYSLYHLFGS